MFADQLRETTRAAVNRIAAEREKWEKIKSYFMAVANRGDYSVVATETNLPFKVNTEVETWLQNNGIKKSQTLVKETQIGFGICDDEPKDIWQYTFSWFPLEEKK